MNRSTELAAVQATIDELEEKQAKVNSVNCSIHIYLFA